MPRPKITEVGKLRFLDDGGLVCSVILDEPPSLEASARAASLYWASPDPSGLAVGDLVTHAEYGIARYGGRYSVNVDSGEKRDLLVLEFADDGQICVQDDRSDVVQKIGDAHHPPIELSTLSTKGRKGGKWLQSYCIEALPNAYEWPGIGTFPILPQESTPNVRRLEFSTPTTSYQRAKVELLARKAERRALLAHQELMAEGRRDWRRACVAYRKALHADASYRQAAQEYFERQGCEPQPLLNCFWVYRGVVVRVRLMEWGSARDEHLLLIKRYVLRREREGEKLRREVETLENYENLENAGREPIPENVRLFVWRRDNGQCVKCGSRERLEFDHIIPVVAGGSNTERNIQILCESCNRSKSATV
jgi:hypothetical protein